jgi:hypothetical protein
MQQRILFHNECVEISMKVQDHLGFLPCKNEYKEKRRNDRVGDTFLADNCTVVSKLTDILNKNLKRNLLAASLSSNKEQKTIVYSHNYCAQPLKIAATFCATVFQDKACMWHISQGVISDFSKEAQTSLYDSVQPEKQHVTLLLKGNSVKERIIRINL